MEEQYFYTIDQGHKLPHDPFKAIIAPRPIGWISSISKTGILNLAPYSFFNAVSDKPPMLIFSSKGKKDSVTNIENSEEFVWNMATRSMAEKMNITSRPVPADTDEFDLGRIKTAPSRLVQPPRVAASPAAMECKLANIIELKDMHGKSTDHWLVIGQVIGVHIDQTFLKDGLFDTGAANPILRAGYLDDYAEARIDTMFKMDRPKG